MKTFEVYKLEEEKRTLIVSVQADYYESENYRIQFFRKRLLLPDREIARMNCSHYLLIADTEFLLDLPEDTFVPTDAGKEAAERFTAEVEPEYCNAGPTPPRRRKSKGSTLGLD